MSLNGLDDLKIKEAYETAVAEPGGWFLLKYVSRDEVDLLGRGNGGIVEIRKAITQYEEPSPLFGFLRYRRRNVVIKYVPEDCSRLVQARVTVHFTAVTERFSPHDTVFPISSPKELRDTTLSAACSLHTASGSTSSSTSSLRRRRLMEIAEDAEEEHRAKRQSTVPEERPPTAKTSSVSGPQATDQPESSHQLEVPNGLPHSMSSQTILTEAETSSSTSREPRPSEIRSRSPAGSYAEPRKSSQSTRPDIYSYYSSNGKPKVKLGPRPSLDVGGRPHTSSASSFYRPVSTLPAGLKLFSRGSKKEKARPKSLYPSEPPSMTISPPPVPDSLLSPPISAPVRPHTSGGRPNTSSNSTSKPLMSPTLAAPKTPTITPEKARLLRAMELRKKKAAALPSESIDPAPNNHLMIAITPNSKSSPEALPKETLQTLDALDDIAKGDDSDIAFDASSTLKTDESDATRSDSYPVSPVGPSEQAESTRASSISESTDETIQEPNNLKQVPADEPNSDGKKAEIETISVGPAMTPNESTTPTFPEATTGEHSEIEHDDKTPVSITSEDSAVAQVPEILEELGTSVTTLEIEPVTEPLPESELPQTPPNGEAKEWKVPRSKFSVQDLRAAQNLPEGPRISLPTSKFSVQVAKSLESMPDISTASRDHSDSIPVPPESPVGSTSSKRSYTEVKDDDQSLKHTRRRGLIEPIRTDLDVNETTNAADSEGNFSSDDDLMDELQSAVFEEAKPMSVSKSPISPVFPSPNKRTDQSRFSRAFSSPMRKQKPNTKTLEAPTSTRTEPSRSVSASAAYLNRINQQPAVPMAKKVNLGSGISQRIKALEKLSSSSPGVTTAPGTTGPPPGASPAFFSVRKGTARGSRSPSIAERANSLTKTSPSASPSVSRESSPETLKLRERSGSIQSRVDAFKSTTPSQTAPRSRPESISVTARIIRDPAQPFAPKPDVRKDPSEFPPLDLKQSPLVIDHQKAVVEPSLPKETILERRQSKERRLSNASKTTTTTTKERRSSITIVKDLINDARTSISERRRSINLETSVTSPSVKSSSRPPSVHASPGHHRPMSISSRISAPTRDLSNGLSPPPTSGSSSSNSEEKDKKSNRAGRMLRRMSSSLSASRKNIAHMMSPTVREESEPTPDNSSPMSSHPSQSSMTPTTTSVDIGDVNVQFPDTLLWKRRSMLLDSQGYLIMSPATSGTGKEKGNVGGVRRFHLSEFRTPEVPDVEMQELPNSVILDFVEGGGLQVACEDRAGQARVLKILQETHRTWAAFGQ